MAYKYILAAGKILRSKALMFQDFLFYDGCKENSYPPRSNDCMPSETEFSCGFELAQEDVEMREKNAGQADLWTCGECIETRLKQGRSKKRKAN